MKVQEFAKDLNISVKDCLDFLRQHGLRMVKPGTKLDPGSVTKFKRLYATKLDQENSSSEEVFEEKTISFSGESIKVSELTALFGLPMQHIMKSFLSKGLLVNVNSEIDTDTLVNVAESLNITVDVEDTSAEEEIGLKTKVLELEEQSMEGVEDLLETRPPVIAVMGHVDHGKTLLIDKIRSSNVVSGESGGITQHIGAYQIKHQEHTLTFLDTPGHEAFTSLRARGAQITDIAILVVAADDGVKPQTIEAINHAQVADVPIIVALNKMDKPDADIEKVKQQLSAHNLISEDWGGQTIMVPVSAKTSEGIDSLLEMIVLTAELQELKANPSGLSKAVVIEAELSAQKGPIATVIVKAGSLSIGDYFSVDGEQGKVRAIFNDRNEQVQSLKPGDPGEILGFSVVPSPGSIVESHLSEKECKLSCEAYQRDNQNTKKQTQKMSVSLEALSSQAEDGDLRQLNLIIKADVQGSLEAIKGSIEKIESQDIPIKIIHFSTGSITENDVLLAKASRGVVFGFHVEPTVEAKKVAELENVAVRTYSIIYEILEDIQRVIQGLYKVEYVEIEKATIEVRELFKFSKIGVIAGCYVDTGVVDRNCKIRVMRGKDVVVEDELDSLKRFKDDVKEVSHGFECGIVLKGKDALQVGDKLIAYKLEEKKLI